MAAQQIAATVRQHPTARRRQQTGIQPRREPEHKAERHKQQAARQRQSSKATTTTESEKSCQQGYPGRRTINEMRPPIEAQTAAQAQTRREN